MIGYKVVKKKGAKYISAIVNSRSRYCVSYEVGEKTIPPVGVLFAFSSYAHAERFARYRDAVVFRAELEGAYSVHRLAYSFTAPAIKRFWRGNAGANAVPPPDGTMGCTGITLLEQM